MSDPRCPYCNTSGAEFIVAQNLATFTLIYCAQCGAIHGVLPLIPAAANPPPAKKKVSAPSDSAPDGYPNAGHRMWVCPGYKECRAWELIE